MADWQVVVRGDVPNIDAMAAQFGFPVVVKPVREGSSLGLTLAKSPEELAEGVALGLQFDSMVMVEEYLQGRELTAGVLGNKELEALPVIEIVPGKEFAFFDYQAKYQPGATQEICPADIPDSVRQLVQTYALRAHEVLRLRGYSRTDFIQKKDGSLYLLETNTIPGMTETSLLPQAAFVHGLTFPQLLERLIDLGMEEI